MRNFCVSSVVLLQSTQTHYCSVVNKSGFKSLAACLRRLLTTWKHFAGAVNVLAKFFFFLSLFFLAERSSQSFGVHTSKQMLGTLPRVHVAEL